MKILFISTNTEGRFGIVMPIGLLQVAQTAKKAGHEIKIEDFYFCSKNPHEDIKKTINDFQPELIGITVRNIDNGSNLHETFYLDSVKELVPVIKLLSNAPIVLGGTGYSIFPKEILEYTKADYGISGKGEESFLDFVQLFSRKGDLSSVPGLYAKGFQAINPPESKDVRSKLIDKDILSYLGDLSKISFPFKTRSGCAMMCTYCTTPFLEGTKMHTLAVEEACELLKKYYDMGVRIFSFTDSVFNIPPSYTKELCRAIIKSKIKISWDCELNPLKNIDQEMVSLMLEAGCTNVFLGNECGSPLMLKSYNKHFSLDDVERASDLFTKAKIDQFGFLLFGGPGESIETIEESVSFISKLNFSHVQVNFGVRIYPHTKIWEQSLEEKIITENENLLFPKYYISKHIEKEIPAITNKLRQEHPNWFI